MVGALALLAYLSMTPAASGDKDGSEFTLVLATLGAAHPTGYALYTLVGHGVVLMVHGLGTSWPFAANAFSAIGGAVAMGLLHALSARLLRGVGVGGRSAAALALLPAIAFGMNPIWTMECTLAEVNSWHVAWVIGLALFVRWAPDAMSRVERPVSPRRIAALGGLLVGVGLTHHLTSVFFSLPLGVALLLALGRRDALRPDVLMLGFGTFALALSSIAYVFWRASHPALMQWPLLNPETAWDHVLGAQYRGYLGHFAPSDVQRRFLSAYVYPWLGPSLLFLLTLPIVRTRCASRAWRIAVSTSAVVQTAYVFRYGVPDPSPYFLPLLALGLALMPAWLAEVVPAVRRSARWIAGPVAVWLIIVSVGWTRIGQQRASTYERFDDLVHRMWLSVPFEDGFVIWGDDMVHRLREYQLLRGEKPRVVALNPAQVTYPGPRAVFIKRFGFDPLAELPSLPPPVDAPSTRALFEAIATRINTASPLPVVVFDPAGPSVRLLQKPGGPGPAPAAGIPR
ncbi:MAG: DUF2723 domain-containing protein [Candidatus Eisenbacteria bacterium]